MNEASLQDLFSLIHTKYEATRFSSTLSKLIEALYNVKTPFEKELDTLLSEQEKELLLRLCQNNNITLSDKSGLQAFFTKIQQSLEHVPVMTVTLAFEPPVTFVREMSLWLCDVLGNHVLIETIVDPSIIAGAIIATQGTYADFSIKKRLQEYFSKRAL